MLPESRQKKSAALANIREKLLKLWRSYRLGNFIPIFNFPADFYSRRRSCGVMLPDDWLGDEDEPETSASTCTNTTVPQPPPRRRSSPTILHQKETEETRHLSLTDLQRLVLVEQLAALKEQRAYYKEKSERLSGNYQNTSDNAQNIDNTSLFASYTQM
ncbi:hypothetical protein ANN_19188 [Periplaneta americana]|uniref:Uncharacterized protein n=1 Tax=Periplaneta americana TaxID=6978 RepID=A0ABQ8S9E8_PERAM|nr:hypothetical protein ANN_19188 [Periplaneta americana]